MTGGAFDNFSEMGLKWIPISFNFDLEGKHGTEGGEDLAGWKIDPLG